jgi:hypothetical protein
VTDLVTLVDAEFTPTNQPWDDLATAAPEPDVAFPCYAPGTATRPSFVVASARSGIGTATPAYTMGFDGIAGKPGGGSWADASDERLKKNIAALDGREALERLRLLSGVTFEWVNPHEHAPGVHAGFLSQEVERAFPDWFTTVPAQGSDAQLVSDGLVKSLFFPHDFNAYLVEAIKTLEQRIAEREAAINALQRENKHLFKRMEEMQEIR